MKSPIYLLLLISINSFGQANKESQRIKIDEKAKELNERGIDLAITYNNDSIVKAISLFEQAIKIQPNYYLAYWNLFVYQYELGLANESFETLMQLEELKPGDPTVKVISGIFIENNGDSLKAKEKFLQADTIYQSILDTLPVGTEVYHSNLINKAINLKYLGREDEGNHILKQLEEKMKNTMGGIYYFIHNDESKRFFRYLYRPEQYKPEPLTSVFFFVGRRNSNQQQIAYQLLIQQTE